MLFSLLLLALLGAVCLALVAGESQTLVGDEKSEKEVPSCGAENDKLLKRIEHLESKIFNVSHFNPDSDEVSLMEKMYMKTSTWIIESIPETDEDCRFDWLIGKCTPLCKCKLQPKIGDYNPGRACRRVPDDKIDESCDTSASISPWFVRGIRKTRKQVNRLLTHIAETAPATDNDCKFDWFSFKCTNGCVFDYSYGDYSLNRACRRNYDAIDSPATTTETDSDDII